MNLVREGNERLLEGERVNEVVWKCLMNMLIAKYKTHQGKRKSRLDRLSISHPFAGCWLRQEVTAWALKTTVWLCLIAKTEDIVRICGH